MAAPTQDDFNKLIKEIKNLTASMGKSKDDRKADTRATLSLTAQLGSVYKIQEALTKAADLQTKTLRYNVDASKVLSSTLTKAPGFTNLETGMAMLEAGLEDNSKGLGDFFARSSLLGENIEQMAFGLRSLRGSLALNNTQTVTLAKAIGDSAKTYGTSSERLIDSLNKFGNTLAILNRTSSGQNQALIDLTAATDRVAPGAVASILGPLLGGGAESLGRLGVLGAGTDAAALMSGEGGMAAGLGIFEKIVDLRDQIVGTGEQAIIGAQIFEQMTGLTLAQANLAETVATTIKEQEGRSKLDAILADGLGTLNSIMKEFTTPIANFIEGLVASLGGIKAILQGEIVNKLIKTAGMTTVLFSMLAVLKLIASAGIKNAIIGTLIFAALYHFMPYLEKSFKALMKNVDNTGTTASIAKKTEERKNLSLLEEYNKRHAATFSTLIRESGRMNVEPSLSDRMAKEERERQTQILDSILRATNDQIDLISRNKSAFSNNSPIGINR